MASVYTEIPHNWSEIEPYVLTDAEMNAEEIFRRGKCFFYDACSFRRHASLDERDAGYLLQYMREQDGVVIVTRCILMELASHSGILNPEYLQYIKRMERSGIKILVLYEEDIFAVMSKCFSTNAAINSYLQWAVRMMKGPVSTITGTLHEDNGLYDEIIKGKNSESQGMYRRFFASVRGRKESGDNLGEEMLAICLHILSHLPGEADGKFSVITDDKGAAGRIDTLFRNTAGQFKGNQIAVFSTPRLVQMLYAERILADKASITSILSAGTNGRVVVLGTLIYDLHIHDISVTVEELADLIQRPSGINIIF